MTSAPWDAMPHLSWLPRMRAGALRLGRREVQIQAGAVQSMEINQWRSHFDSASGLLGVCSSRGWCCRNTG